MRWLIALTSAALAATGLPAVAVASDPIQSVTVEHAAEGEGGYATIRVVLAGTTVDTITGFSAAPAVAPAPLNDVGATVTAELRGFALEGPGRLSYPPIAIATSGAVPALRACARGGYPAVPTTTWSSSDRETYVHIPAGASTSIVLGVRVPGGFEGVESGLVISARSLEPDDRAWGEPRGGWGEPISLPLTRSAVPSDAIRFSASERRGGRTRVSGQVFPPRAGAVVEFVGRKFRADQETAVLVPQLSALQPVGERLRQYGELTTGADGRFAAWITLPERATLVARTTGIPGRTLPGASCPVAIKLPPTSPSVGKSNAKTLVAMVEACFTATSDYRRCRKPVAHSLGSDTGLRIVQRAPRPGEVRVVAAGRDGYEATAVDDTKTSWIITKTSSTGRIKRTCRLASGRACRPATW